MAKQLNVRRRFAISRVVQRLLAQLERGGLIVLLGLTLLLFLASLLLDAGSGKSLWQAILDTTTGDDSAAGNWNKAAHLALAVTLGWAAVKVYLTTLGLKMDAWVASHLARDHLIIFAGQGGAAEEVDGGKKGRRAGVEALAIELAHARSATGTVVLALPGIEEADRRRLWNLGVHVIQDELPLADLIDGTGVTHARQLLCMRNNPHENVLLAMAALQRGRPDLNCLLMNGHSARGNRLPLNDYLAQAWQYRIRQFNDSELIARNLWLAFPPYAGTMQQRTRAHVVVVGMGSIGQSMLRRLALLGHFHGGLRPRVTIIENNIGDKLKALLQDHPVLGDLLDFNPIDLAVVNATSTPSSQALQSMKAAQRAYVCTKDEIFNLRIGRWLCSQLTDAEVIVLDPPGGCVLAALQQEYGARTEQGAAAHGRVHLYALGHPAKGSDNPLAAAVLDGADDRLPRLLHESYRKQELAKQIDNSLPESALEWERTSETYRESNRLAVDHFSVKLHALGKELKTADAPDEATQDLKDLTGHIRSLARMEHARWMADRALVGGRLGNRTPQTGVLGERDRKTLVPFAYLTSSECDKDIHQVKSILDYFAGGLPDTEKPGQVIVGADSPSNIWRWQPSPEDFDAIAANLLHDHPIDLSSQHQYPVHLLVHGSGNLAQAFLRRVAQSALRRAGHAAHVTWVTANVPQGLSQISTWLDGAGRWLTVHSVEQSQIKLAIEQMGSAHATADNTDSFISVDPSGALHGYLPITAVYLCPDPEEELPGLVDSMSKELVAAMAAGRNTRFDVVGVAWEAVPVCKVQVGYLAEARLHWVHAGDLLMRLQEAELALASPCRAERLARRLHEGYRERVRSKNSRAVASAQHASDCAWESLPEPFKRSNRASVHHLPIKLKTVGRQLVRSGSAMEAPLEPVEVEKLAELEHDRWWADRACAGWQYSSSRDDERRLHPDMLPYDQLSESVRQLDRDKVVDLLRALGEDGWILTRA